jgi:hypothetical protein
MCNKTISLITLLLVFLLFATTSFSQTKPLKFGIKGKLNFADVTETILPIDEMEIDGLDIPIDFEQKMYTNIGFGGFLEYWVSPMFAIQSNILYNVKGTKLTGSFFMSIDTLGVTADVNIDAEATGKLTYLSVPILGKLALGQEGAIRPYFVAGPEIGFLLAAKVNMKADASITYMGMKESESFSDDIDIKDEVESMEFALDFGAGVEIPVGNMSIFVDGQYSLGLTKVNKESAEGMNDIKNKVIYVNLGIIF